MASGSTSAIPALSSRPLDSSPSPKGRNKHHYVTVNAGFGEEAYQIVGPNTVLSRFLSQNLTITWRQWTGKNWGFNFVADYYHSPFYQRGGGSFGFFKEF